MHALGAEQVLDAERHAFERPRLAARDPLVGRPRHVARLLRRRHDVGVEQRVRRLDRREIGLGQLQRGKVPLRQPVADLGDGQGRSGRPSIRPPSARRSSGPRAAGALARMSSAQPPSVTRSSRFFIRMGVTEVIGSTPVDVDLVQLLDEAEDGVELAPQRLQPPRRRRGCAPDAPPASRCSRRRTFFFPERLGSEPAIDRGRRGDNRRRGRRAKRRNAPATVPRPNMPNKPHEDRCS